MKDQISIKSALPYLSNSLCYQTQLVPHFFPLTAFEGRTLLEQTVELLLQFNNLLFRMILDSLHSFFPIQISIQRVLLPRDQTLLLFLLLFLLQLQLLNSGLEHLVVPPLVSNPLGQLLVLQVEPFILLL